MNGAGIFNGFRLGSRAPKAVHADAKQHFCGFGIVVHQFTDQCFFCNDHFPIEEILLVLVYLNLVYYNEIHNYVVSTTKEDIS